MRRSSCQGELYPPENRRPHSSQTTIPLPSGDQGATGPPPRLTAVTSSPPAPADAADAPARRATLSPTPIDLLRDGRQLTDRWQAWLVTVIIAGVAFAIRFVHLGYPPYLIFDETYYPKDAWTLLHLGYEANWPDASVANKAIAAGNVFGFQQATAGFKPGAEFVVHPPLGKWLIALGEWAFGMNSFGWRFPSLVAGTILVAATIRLGRRLSRSTLVGALAGVLLTFDGLAFTMSRIGLLDIFQAMFLVLAVSFVVCDRDWFRLRLARHLERTGQIDLGGSFGPHLWWRPWRLAAGLTFGLACGVKWNSMFVLFTMAILSVLWDRSARHLAGAGKRSWWSLLRDGVPAAITLGVLAVAVYIATWWGWFATQGGWDRQWGRNPAPDADSIFNRHHGWLVHHLGSPLASWIYYHHEIYAFHTGEYMKEQTHVYNSNPAGWLFMTRPIGLDAVNGIKPGQQGCTAVNDTCLRVISGAGTPTLWWLCVIGFIIAIIWWVAGRDWRVVPPLLAACSTWIPWFRYDDRPVFFFYAICIIPFTVILLAMVMGRFIGPPDGPHRRRNAWIVGAVVSLVVLNFAFQYPILTDQLLTRRSWWMRMWFPTWI